MLAQSENSQISKPRSPVSKISVQARVDYILKFSKHPAIVLSQQKQSYSNIASLFLTMLPERQNAAFVSASEKLTNIQLRCRLIEQLFGDALFDPEQPMYVSISRLLKQQPEPITIVIEHAHYLTRQMLHELCQFSEFAKKSNKSVGIALFGDFSLGAMLANEKAVFDKRISIISAEQGQLLPLKAKLFKQPNAIQYGKPVKVILFVVLLLIVAGGLYQLFIGEALVNNPQKTTTEVHQPERFVVPIANEKPVISKQVSPIKIESKQLMATPSEIINAIQTTTTKLELHKVVSATPNEINLALLTVPTKTVQKKPESLARQLNKIDAQYYRTWKTGFVIQYAGFYEYQTYQQFLIEHPSLVYMGYHRQLHNKDYIVITSVVYPSKQQALVALNGLSKALQADGAWIKSVGSIHREINDFNLTKT